MHLLFALLAGSSPVRAAASYPIQQFPAAGVRRVVIGGVRGQVRVRGRRAPAFRLRVAHSAARTGDDWGLSVERRGDALVLEVFSTAVGREWRPLLARDRWPTYDLELEGPPVPLVVGWRDGAIDVARWPASVDASLLDGRVRLNGVGEVHAQVGRGEVDVRDVRGGVDVRGEAGRLSLADVRGPGRVRWFSGHVALERVRAGLDLEGFASTVDARDGAGAWRLDVPTSRVRLANFDGRLVPASRAH